MKSDLSIVTPPGGAAINPNYRYFVNYLSWRWNNVFFTGLSDLVVRDTADDVTVAVVAEQTRRVRPLLPTLLAAAAEARPLPDQDRRRRGPG